MFGKKKVEAVEPKEVKTEVEDVSLESDPVMQEVERDLQEIVIVSPQEVANMSEAQLRSLEINLLGAILKSLKELKD